MNTPAGEPAPPSSESATAPRETDAEKTDKSIGLNAMNLSLSADDPAPSPTGPMVAPAIPLTNGTITWTDDADGKAQQVMYDYSASLRKRSEEEAQLNMSTTVSPHYVDTAAKQLRLHTKPRKWRAVFANLGSLAAGGAISACVGTLVLPTPDATVLVVSAIFLAGGTGSLVYGSSQDH